MFCVSLFGKEIAIADQYAEEADLLEIRLDLCEIENKDALLDLFSKDYTTVATCRPTKVWGESRIDLLKAAVDKGADYVDVEFDMLRADADELIHYAKDRNCKVIVSYHNYFETPSKPFLFSVIEKSRMRGADIIKIACMAEAESDITALLSLNNSQRDVLAFAMGELGAASRILCLDKGAPFTYVAANNESRTAPGQLTIAEIKEILKD